MRKDGFILSALTGKQAAETPLSTRVSHERSEQKTPCEEEEKTHARACAEYNHLIISEKGAKIIFDTKVLILHCGCVMAVLVAVLRDKRHTSHNWNRPIYYMSFLQKGKNRFRPFPWSDFKKLYLEIHLLFERNTLKQVLSHDM